MEEKKRVVILVIIALLLAITAIALNATTSNEIKTTKQIVKPSATGAVVGIQIQSVPIEDKLLEKEK